MSDPVDTAAPQRALFGDYQYDIYGRGLAGETPALPLLADDLQERARERMSPEAFGYVAGAAGAELTVAANRGAFERWEIVPRMLRDVAQRDLSASVLGTVMPAPVGVQSTVPPDAELAVGRAAAAVGLPFILSTAASSSMEDVAGAVGEA